MKIYLIAATEGEARANEGVEIPASAVSEAVTRYLALSNPYATNTRTYDASVWVIPQGEEGREVDISEFVDIESEDDPDDDDDDYDDEHRYIRCPHCRKIFNRLTEA